MGFFIAPIEALPEISVTDIYFTHQRGTYMGIYSFALAGSNYFAPVICGYIAERQGWQWVFYWPAIFNAVTFIFLFFFLEESNYTRKTLGVVNMPASLVFEPAEVTDSEKAQPRARQHFETIEPGRRKKTFVQKLSLWHISRGQSPLQRVKRSLQYLSWPVIAYCGFSYGSYLILFNILNATASIILSGEPYLFSPSKVGLSYLCERLIPSLISRKRLTEPACCIGVIIGSLTSGRFSDWLTIKLARRNSGIMEAEHRLWPFATCLVLVPGSLLLWGVGAAQQVHWFGLIFAMGCLAYTSSLGVTLSVNYMIDSYHEICGDAIVTVILIRNTMSFAVNYG